MLNRKVIVFFLNWLLPTFVLVTVDGAEAQSKIPKIGWLALRPLERVATSPSGRDLFWREFRALGYVEGKNVTFEFRSAENKRDRLPALADELVRLKVDVIIAAASNETRAAKKATPTIPIVFLSSADPVEAGLVASVARPGGNLTGFSNFQNLLTGKRLEILKESLPNLVRVGILHNPRNSLDQWNENQTAAKTLGLQVHSMVVSSVDEFANAFNGAVKARCAALAVATDGFLNSHMARTVELAVKHRLPAIYGRSDFVETGGLMSYGTDLMEPYKRIASMVDKILKGTKPADIPVEQPTKFEFVVNLKSAKHIGVTIPPEVLARANRIIR